MPDLKRAKLFHPLSTSMQKFQFENPEPFTPQHSFGSTDLYFEL